MLGQILDNAIETAQQRIDEDIAQFITISIFLEISNPASILMIFH
jgi:hypothetical protein